MEQMESGASDVVSGAQAESVATEGSVETKVSVDKSVKWEDHKRALEDLHKFKASQRELERKLVELERTREQEQLKKLEEEQQFKKLWETSKQKISNLEQENSNIKQSYFIQEKFNAVKAAALKAGMFEQAIDDFTAEKLEDVVIEKTDQGRVIVHGAEEFVDKLKKSRPFMFRSTTAPVVNSGGASMMTDQDVTMSQVVELERKWRRTQSKQDRAAYETAYVAYRKSRK